MKYEFPKWVTIYLIFFYSQSSIFYKTDIYTKWRSNLEESADYKSTALTSNVIPNSSLEFLNHCNILCF